ncbi:hypothetical protein NHX12_007423 [Muraenolepis orangiensis]|uniref:Uncharacterized protein n=1 Tax=Muraenolepis orangiensis TaxID=630683 RepID=A0A9Q0DSC6_9TELE|nr:hypothetical protein NHX12_007423 [Muraenolepis orangiensis]
MRGAPLVCLSAEAVEAANAIRVAGSSLALARYEDLGLMALHLKYLGLMSLLHLEDLCLMSLLHLTPLDLGLKSLLRLSTPHIS